jgi:hypothetical protein
MASTTDPQQNPDQQHATWSTVRVWQLVSAALAVMWFITWMRLRGRSDARPVAPTRDSISTGPTPADWRKALSHDSPAALARALVETARRVVPDCSSVSDLAARLGDGAQREVLRQLEFVLYRGADDAGLLQALRAAFSRGPRWKATGPSAATSTENALPPLYPER